VEWLRSSPEHLGLLESDLEFSPLLEDHTREASVASCWRRGIGDLHPLVGRSLSRVRACVCACTIDGNEEEEEEKEKEEVATKSTTKRQESGSWGWGGVAGGGGRQSSQTDCLWAHSGPVLQQASWRLSRSKGIAVRVRPACLLT